MTSGVSRFRCNKLSRVRDALTGTARSTPLDNVIDVQMTRLRKKVDLEGPVRLIHTVRGVGFVLREGEL